MQDRSATSAARRGGFSACRFTARLAVTPLDLTSRPGAMLEAIADEDDAVMLDSSALHEDFGRYTVLACRPVDVLTLRGRRLSDASGCVLAKDDRSLWRALARAFGGVKLSDPPEPGGGPIPGWIGYVGYEVGRRVERLPGRAGRDTPLPDLRLGFYDALLVYDATEDRWRMVELVFDSPPAGAGAAAPVLRAIAARAIDSTGCGPATVESADATVLPAVKDAKSNFSPDEYRAAIARCIDYIAAGDIFQVNLSQRFTVDPAPRPVAIYDALRRRNPAWFAAYLAFVSDGQPCAILSSSPELFLRLDGRHVVTRPIKGTRPRVGRAAADRAAAADLLASEKDNAELAMIIDLLRNDLGRVCLYGTVRVIEPRRLETHPTVFHLVGTVVGELCPGVGPAELLRATFPGGSITGAPKIRAMEIIDELEPQARGVYTGCIGHVAVDGSCQWNIAIRTIVYHQGKAQIQAGGGIVADSRPDAEYEETLDKARAMFEAIAKARSDVRAKESQPAAAPDTGRAGGG